MAFLLTRHHIANLVYPRNSNLVRQKLYVLNGRAFSKLEAPFRDASSKEYLGC